MKLFTWGKDGGPESKVWGFWLVESKRFGSIALLKFEHGTRDVYHNHAFNSVSWLLSGMLIERIRAGGTNFYYPGLLPVVTKRDTFHQVTSFGTTWAITFRGPWKAVWFEYVPTTGEEYGLTNGRKRVA